MVREKKQSLTVFIGDRRGSLTPTQRAEVGMLASSWRREASGGMVIEVPVGGPNEHAGRSVAREVRGVLAATGVPHNSIEVRAIPTQDPARLGVVRINYPRMAAETGPCGTWPDDVGITADPMHCGEQALPESTAAPFSAILPPRSRTPPIWSSRAASSPRLRHAARRSSTSIARATRRRRHIRMPTRARSATWANDQICTQTGGDPSAASTDAAGLDEHIATVPRISIQAFCTSADTAGAMQSAGEDRRMSKAHLKIQMGGIAAAIEAYRSSATPNVIVIEADGRGEELLAGLDSLSDVCDPGTRVLVVGYLNDIVLYRETDAAGRQRLPDRAGWPGRSHPLGLRPVPRG